MINYLLNLKIFTISTKNLNHKSLKLKGIPIKATTKNISLKSEYKNISKI